jgi:hypothetical protein
VPSLVPAVGVASVRARLLSYFLSLTVLLLAVAPVAATSISTDLWVYQQGDTVNVTGDGFDVSENVEIVTTDPYGVEVDRGTVLSDAYGNIAYSFVLNSGVPGIYDVVATGLSSGLTASAQFDPPAESFTFTNPAVSVNYSDLVTFAGTIVCTVSKNDSAPCPDRNAASSNQLTITIQIDPAGGPFTGTTVKTVTGVDVDYNTGTAGNSCNPPANGSVTCTIAWSFTWQAGRNAALGDVAPGTYDVRAVISGAGIPSGSQTVPGTGGYAGGVVITREQTSVSYGGSLSATEGTSLPVSAQVVDADGGSGLGNGVFSPDPMLASSVATVDGVSYQLWSAAFCLGSSAAGPVYHSLTSAGNASGGSLSLAAVTQGTYYLKTTYFSNTYYAGASDCDQIDVASAVIHVTAAITADNKVYDGTTDATFDCDLVGVAFGDDVTCDISGASASFADKDVGTWTVTATGLDITGADAGNYVLDNGSDTDEADITVRHLSAAITADNKVYDGTTDATFDCDLSNVVLLEDVTCDISGASASFADKDVGTWTVTATGLDITGADAGNYVLDNGSDTDEADITQRDLHVIAEDKTKYFGEVNPALTWHYQLSDFVSGEGASDIDTPPTCSTTAGQFSLPGDFPITCSGSDNNYNLLSVDGTLHILFWTLKGFYQPVDMLPLGVVNTVKGGSTVPLKFEVFAGSTELTSVDVVKTFTVQQVGCGFTGTEDPIELYSTGGTSLRYDSTGGQFIQNWQTPKAAGKCYTVILTTDDGSMITALFKTK